MKNRLWFTIASLVCSVGISHAASVDAIHFYESNWEQLAAKADQEDKLLFIQFTADNCAPCRWLDQHTFSDQSLIDLLSERFVPVRWNGSARAHMDYLTRFDIEVIPTTIVVKPTGEEVGRIVETMSAGKLVDFLQGFDREGQAPHGKMATGDVHPSGSALFPSRNYRTLSSLNYNPFMPLPRRPKAETVKPVAVDHTPTAKGYVLQLGVYTNLPKVEARIHELEKLCPGRVHLFVEQHASGPFFKVVIGYFPTAHQAIHFNNQLPHKWRKRELVKDLYSL